MLKLFVLLMSVVSLISCSKSSDSTTSSPKSDKSFSSSNSLKDLKINLNPEKLIEFKKNVSSTIQANDLALKELEISKADLQDKLNLRNIEKTKLEQNLQSDEKLKIEKLDKILILNQEIAALEAEKLAKTDTKTKEELLRTRRELQGSRKVLNELKVKKNKCPTANW